MADDMVETLIEHRPRADDRNPEIFVGCESKGCTDRFGTDQPNNLVAHVEQSTRRWAEHVAEVLRG